jgi:hypothetical protein
LIDLKEMPIDEYKQTVVAREQKYTDWRPSLDDLLNAMFWPCCSLFSFKALLYFRHLYYFS